MGELESDSVFIQELRKGHSWQLWVAVLFLKEGFIVEVPKLEIRPGRAKINDYTDNGDISIHVNGRRNRFECKSRNLDFNSSEDYPYETALVDRVNTWKRKADKKPLAVILVSQITGNCVVVPVSTEQKWKIETKRDDIRGYEREYFLVEKNDLKNWDDFISWLRLKNHI